MVSSRRRVDHSRRDRFYQGGVRLLGGSHVLSPGVESQERGKTEERSHEILGNGRKRAMREPETMNESRDREREKRGKRRK